MTARPLPVVGLGLAVAAFVAGSVAFVALDAVLDPVFASLFRMIGYHQASPFGFVAVAAVAFGVVGVLWVRWFGGLGGWRRWATALGAVAVTVLVASAPGGALWVAHDMAAGFVPDGPLFWENLRWGAITGLQAGWLVAALSVPYNLVGVAFGLVALDRAARWAHGGEEV